MLPNWSNSRKLEWVRDALSSKFENLPLFETTFESLLSKLDFD